LIAGLPQINKQEFINIMVVYYNYLASQGLLIKSAEAIEAFKNALNESTVIDLANGKIVANAIAPITSQLNDIFLNFTPTFE
jgi:hypothetical protein